MPRVAAMLRAIILLFVCLRTAQGYRSQDEIRRLGVDEHSSSDLAAFKLSLRVAACNDRLQAAGASKEVHFSPLNVEEGISLAGSLDQSVPCAAGSDFCSLHLRVGRPDFQEEPGVAFDGCVELPRRAGTPSWWKASEDCQKLLPGGKGDSFSWVTLPFGVLVCAEIENDSISRVGFRDPLAVGGLSRRNLLMEQKQQDANTYAPYEAIEGLLEGMEAVDSKPKTFSTLLTNVFGGSEKQPYEQFFASLEGIAWKFYETTRDRESMMKAVCDRVKPMLASKEDADSTDVLALTDRYCLLAGRTGEGTPTVYSDAALAPLPAMCSEFIDATECDASQAETAESSWLNFSIAVPWRQAAVPWRHAACGTLNALLCLRRRERLALESKVTYLRNVTRIVKGNVLVAGGGPVGLMQALFASTTGANVVVMEKRHEFSRLNAMMVHKYTALLTELGADQLDDFRYVDFGTLVSPGNAQRLLSRMAPIFGVEVRMSQEFIAYCPPEADQSAWLDDSQGVISSSWYAVFRKHVDLHFDSFEQSNWASNGQDMKNQSLWAESIRNACERKAEKPWELSRHAFDVLVGAEGTRSPTRDQAFPFRASPKETASGPYNETYDPISYELDPNGDIGTGVVVAVQQFTSGAQARAAGGCLTGLAPKPTPELDQPYYTYTFPYLTRSYQGYCWNGFIVGPNMKDHFASEKKRGMDLTKDVLGKLFTGSFGHAGLTPRDLVFKARHEPERAVFPVKLHKADKSAVYQTSSGGAAMVLLLAGDAAVTPWFPMSVGVNGGGSRASLRVNIDDGKKVPAAGAFLYAVRQKKRHIAISVAGVMQRAVDQQMDQQLRHAMLMTNCGARSSCCYGATALKGLPAVQCRRSCDVDPNEGGKISRWLFGKRKPARTFVFLSGPSRGICCHGMASTAGGREIAASPECVAAVGGNGVDGAIRDAKPANDIRPKPANDIKLKPANDIRPSLRTISA